MAAAAAAMVPRLKKKVEAEIDSFIVSFLLDMDTCVFGFLFVKLARAAPAAAAKTCHGSFCANQPNFLVKYSKLHCDRWL